MSDKQNIEMVRKYKRYAKRFIKPIYRNTVILFVCAVALGGVAYTSYTVGHKVGSHQYTSFAQSQFEQVNQTKPSDYFTQSVDIGEADFAPFWDAWVLIEQNFVNGDTATTSEETTDQDRVWGAIQGLAASYGDPFTTFLPPEEAEYFESDVSGEFSGVGMEITNRNGVLTVVAPLPGTPADKAGVKPQDVIASIDGEESVGMSSQKAVTLIRGPRGEAVDLELLREGEQEPITVSIVRDTIEIPTIETQVVDGVYIIKLYSFTTQAASQFEDAVREFNTNNYEKMIIDMRGNPGGLLEAAVDISSQFLGSEDLVVTEKYNDDIRTNERYSYGYNTVDTNADVLVLINGGSASAAEIVAGALRDNDRALLGGEQSFGKGSVQKLFKLTRETALKITIAKWLTPRGVDISENGLTPDIAISDTQDSDTQNPGGTFNRDFAEDAVIMQAVEIITQDDYSSFFESVPTELQVQSPVE
jgi:carboxyl-terminal processing protease